MSHIPPLIKILTAASTAMAFAATAPAAAQSSDLVAGPGSQISQQRGGDGGAAGEESFEVAAADCSGAAAEAAARTGGQVLSVSSRQEGGVTVCVVTILVPGQGGDRPRKQTITLRQ